MKGLVKVIKSGVRQPYTGRCSMKGILHTKRGREGEREEEKRGEGEREEREGGEVGRERESLGGGM